jgi:hypothetical protein
MMIGIGTPSSHRQPDRIALSPHLLVKIRLENAADR